MTGDAPCPDNGGSSGTDYSAMSLSPCSSGVHLALALGRDFHHLPLSVPPLNRLLVPVKAFCYSICPIIARVGPGVNNLYQFLLIDWQFRVDLLCPGVDSAPQVFKFAKPGSGKKLQGACRA